MYRFLRELSCWHYNLNEKETHGETDLSHDGCCASVYLVFRKVAQSEEGRRSCLIAVVTSALLNHGTQSACSVLGRQSRFLNLHFDGYPLL